MGTWGTAVFSDDLASDIRSEFKDLIGDGETAEEATRIMLERYASSLDDYDEAPVFWIALAMVQHRLGRLQPLVLEGALKVIDTGEDIRRWEDDPKLMKQRLAVLEKVKSTLLSPQSAPKRVPKRFRADNKWPVGQIVAYRLLSGRFIALRVIGHHHDMGGRSPIVEILDWTGPELPTKRDLKRAPVLPHPHQGLLQIMIGQYSAREFPIGRVHLPPLTMKPKQRPNGYVVLLWRILDKYLERIRLV